MSAPRRCLSRQIFSTQVARSASGALASACPALSTYPQAMSSPPSSARHPARQAGVLIVAVLVSGLAAGFIGIVMAYLLESFEALFYGGGLPDHITLPERVAAAPAWRRVLAPATAGLIAGALWWWERARGGVISVEQVVADAAAPPPPASPPPASDDPPGPTSQTSTTDPIDPDGPHSPPAPASASHGADQGGPGRPTTHLHGLGPRASRMGILRPVGDAILQVLTVSGGNSVGREGAPRLAAGAVATRIALRLHLPRQWAGPLIASAAGAGLAAMYNAPLGGAAYAVEIVMLAGTRRRGTWLAIPTSLIATAVAGLHSGFQAGIPMPHAAATWPTLAATLAVVPLAALAGWSVGRLWSWFTTHRLASSWRLPLGIGAAGLATGVASLWLPILPGNGRDGLVASLAAPATAEVVVVMAGLVLLKPILTGLTLGAGATGGLLAPSFSLGAATGAVLGISLTLTGIPVSLPALALLGAGVTLAVTQRAPIFAAVFVWEIVHGPVWMLPVLILGCLAVVHGPAVAGRQRPCP